MGHQLMHGTESFVAALLGVAQLLGVDPLTDELLLDTLLSHVAEEGTRLRRRIGVGPRAGHLAILLRAPEHLSGQPEAHLPVEHILRAVRPVLLRQTGEEEVALRVRVRVV
ncbi:hypothetical protein MC885_013240 [Smutsia gigantea]|nr:hypothetical protein MC885_013240 [Smutsia gigantea]